jgi:hypothetical protein
MTEADYARKLDELDRLLNDPDVPMQPRRIWALLADVSRFGPDDPSLPQLPNEMDGTGFAAAAD